MLVFGLTGGSGAGKSAAAEIFRRLGVDVVDADKIAHDVTARGTACLDELRREFGDEIIGGDGELNRRKLGDIVFSDKNKLKSLNKITHKYIKAEILSALSASDSEIAAIDGAVIIGSEVGELCAFMVSVLADRAVRTERIVRRDGLSRAQAQSRLNAQPEDDFYIKNSKYVIYNNGSEEELALQIKGVFGKITGNEV